MAVKKKMMMDERYKYLLLDEKKEMTGVHRRNFVFLLLQNAVAPNTMSVRIVISPAPDQPSQA